ncbi:MAG: hypothetical protein EP343_04700 [Deltaproteobacteria bacterium]|nr:MAG: hypothetical protein EP343_04700 [Deltaproteobacteria bacterium]
MAQEKRRWNLATLLGVGFTTLLFGLPSLAFPFGRDQGNYAYAAWVWLDGGAMYRDVFALKPPMTPLTHALAIQWFGHSMVSIRILDLFITLAIGLMLASIVWKLWQDHRAALLAGALYPILYYQSDYWHTSQTDSWNTWPCALAMLLAILAHEAWQQNKSARGALCFAASGFFVGVTFFYKYTFVLMALPIVVYWLLVETRQWKRLIWPILGGLLCIGSMFGWLWWSGALPAFWEVQSEFLPSYVLLKKGTTPGLFEKLGLTFKLMYLRPPHQLAFWCLVGASLVLLWRLRTMERLQKYTLLLVIMWLGLGVFNIVSQGKFLIYHYHGILAPIALLAGISLHALLWNEKLLQRARWLPTTVLVTLCLVLFLMTGPRRSYGTLYKELWSAFNQGWEKHWTQHYVCPRQFCDYEAAEIVRLAKKLRKVTRPNDRVFLWGYDPTLNFIVPRKTVSRFLYNYTFHLNYKKEESTQELLRALRRHPPQIVVIGTRDAVPHITNDFKTSAQILPSYPRLLRYFKQEYHPYHRSKYYFVLQRKTQRSRSTAPKR